MRCILLALLLWAGPVQAGLFEDLGGKPGIARITDGLMRRNHADPRVASVFADADRDRLRLLLTAHLCQLADGPCSYPGRSMVAAHAGLNIRPRHLNALVENMQDAMNEEGIPFATQNQLLARLAPLSTEIIGQ